MPLEAFESANAKLTALYVVHTPHFSHKVKTVIASIGIEVNNDAIFWFFDRVCNHLEDGFPDGELKELHLKYCYNNNNNNNNQQNVLVMKFRLITKFLLMRSTNRYNKKKLQSTLSLSLLYWKR
jgi:hypothetical protein